MKRVPSKELATLFLRLGLTAFGGPAAHVAMMEHEVVHHRKWLSHEEFLDLLGATNLIPGPNSTQMAIQIGLRKGGLRGLLLGGLCFLLPAVAITLVLASLYVAYGTMPSAAPLLLGIRCAVIPIVLGAVAKLGRPMAKNPLALVLGLLVALLSVLQCDAIVLLLGGGAAGMIWANRKRTAGGVLFPALSFPMLAQALPVIAHEGFSTGPSALGLGLFFLKIGSILYGSGYVLLAFLQEGLVSSNHWLTQHQLLDAVAVGQFTPGPVLSTATFVGYVTLGFPGALISTAGIFLPSFVYVLVIGPLVPKLRKSSLMSGFLDGVNAAALGLMLGVCVAMGLSTLLNVHSWIIAAAAAVALLAWSPNPGWIVLGAACLAWLLAFCSL
jgi:chromate transporter